MPIINTPNKHKYNCLFLPGMPGKIKELSVFKDITATGGVIQWLEYSGTYGNQSSNNTFTIESAIADVSAELAKLEKEGLPILVVAYSFSTAILPKINLSEFPSIFGTALFSPIRGLSDALINEDFSETIKDLIASGDVTANTSDWSQESLQLHELIPYTSTLKAFSDYPFPVMFSYSLGDTTIGVKNLKADIDDFRKHTSYNSLLVFERAEGYHKLDTYYATPTGNFFRSLEIELDLIQLLDKDIFVYFWGSSLNFNYSGEGSDIDLLIFSNGYVDRYQELNAYVEQYNATHQITFDLSINNKSDLLSKKIFRYNRGPVAIHELQYAYFPLKRATEILNLSWEDVLQDAYNASLILCGESKKILSKCDLSNDRVKKIIKYSITVYTYLLYIRGDKNLDLNHVEDYLQQEDSFESFIARSIELKKLNYNGMTLDDLYKAVKAIDLIIEDQEKILKVQW